MMSSATKPAAAASASTSTYPDGGGDADEGPTLIPRLAPDEATEAVLRSYLEANRPFVLTDVAAGWRATRAWVVDGEEGDLVTLDRLVASLGSGVRVPVVECGGSGSSSSGGQYGEEPRKEMTLGEYAALWASGRAAAEGLYLKDFHFVLRWLRNQQQQDEGGGQEQQSDYYAVPPPLDDDWLNEWWDAGLDEGGRDDDYRFLYLGPAGSRTPLHHDVLCSYSWSANLSGRKRWLLFHPRDTHRLLLPPPPSGSGAAPMLAADADSPLLADVPRLAVEQGPGEVLFVPSGWHHQVTNLTGCLSLNHNWFNGSALPRVWAFLKGEAAAVRARLRYLEPTFDAEGAGWARQCEAVLRANAAMNLTDWAGLLVGKLGRLVRDGGRHRREDVRRVLAVLRELRGDPCLLDSLFPPHLEARLLEQQQQEQSSVVAHGEEEEEGEVWPPPPPPPQAALRPLVVAWLDEAIAGAAALVGGVGEQHDE